VNIVVADPSSFTAHYDANLCHALARRGHDVALDTSPFLFEPVPALDGYEVRDRFFRPLERRPSLKSRPLMRRVAKAALYPVDVARWARDLQEAPPDVVHLQWSLLPFFDAAVLARLKRARARVVYTVHDVEPFSGSGSGIGRRRLYHAPDALIAHSDVSRKRLIEAYELPRDLVHKIPLGGPGLFAPRPLETRIARERLGLHQEATYLLFFGLIKPHKGLDLLLDAFAEAVAVRAELRLLIAGEVMGRWEPYARQIEARNLTGVVDLRLGFVPTELLAEHFCAADLVVLPYRETFQSGVALAAYTYARPVLATAVGGLPEVVEEGKTGFLAPADDPRALARTIITATQDREALTAMGASAATRLATEHSWDHIAARHEQVYAALTS
jgi:glycosyltransferase involved in cell wall biosynthesis